MGTIGLSSSTRNGRVQTHVGAIRQAAARTTTAEYDRPRPSPHACQSRPPACALPTTASCTCATASTIAISLPQRRHVRTRGSRTPRNRSATVSVWSMKLYPPKSDVSLIATREQRSPHRRRGHRPRSSGIGHSGRRGDFHWVHVWPSIHTAMSTRRSRHRSSASNASSRAKDRSRVREKPHRLNPQAMYLMVYKPSQGTLRGTKRHRPLSKQHNRVCLASLLSAADVQQVSLSDGNCILPTTISARTRPRASQAARGLSRSSSHVTQSFPFW